MARTLSIINGVPRAIDVVPGTDIYEETTVIQGEVSFSSGSVTHAGTTSTYLVSPQPDLNLQIGDIVTISGFSANNNGTFEVTGVTAAEISVENTSGSDQTLFPTVGSIVLETFELPNGKTYTDKELEVYLNDSVLEVGQDYEYVGAAPRTQIKMLTDLVATDRIRFRIARDA